MTDSPWQSVGPDYLVAGRYRLRSKLGGGGMGSVWLARDRLLDREVALKQITSTVGLSAAEADLLRSRAIREGRIAAKLSSAHTIAMYDVALERGEPWLVMEYLPSRSIAQALNIADTLDPVEVAQIGAQVADALAEAHEAGIVHRDIKPGNILVADRGPGAGLVKISDFGIAHATGERDADRPGVITGTPTYFAPEVARGHDPTAASDVFSLGSTLYTAVEGRPPFGFDDQPAMLDRIARGRDPPARTRSRTHRRCCCTCSNPTRRDAPRWRRRATNSSSPPSATSATPPTCSVPRSAARTVGMPRVGVRGVRPAGAAAAIRRPGAGLGHPLRGHAVADRPPA